jgi:ribosomal protein S18 acetylase RimI-like enzyme
MFRLRPREIEEGRVPFMYEVWNWEGDATILPIKVRTRQWFEFLQRVDSTEDTPHFPGLTQELLLQQFIRSDLFDPQAFFFITHRSEVAGSALLWPAAEAGVKELRFVAVHPSHRDKVRVRQQVGEALISIALDYAKKLDCLEVIYEPQG